MKTLAALLVLGCGSDREPAPAPSLKARPPDATAAPQDPLLQVSPGKLHVRLREWETAPEKPEMWSVVAYDLAVGQKGAIEIEIVDRSQPEDPAPASGRALIASTRAVLEPAVAGVARFSFIVRGDEKAKSGEWKLELTGADIKTGTFATDHLAAPDIRPSARASGSVNGSVIRLPPDQVHPLVSLVFYPPLTNQGHLDDPIRLLDKGAWVRPDAFPHPAWFIRVRFAPK